MLGIRSGGTWAKACSVVVMESEEGELYTDNVPEQT